MALWQRALREKYSRAEKYFPVAVDQSLFETINRVKNPSSKTPLEKSHAPVITAPRTVKLGEPFTVEVSVGEVLHPMLQAHWIEFIALEIGNEPAGRVDFEPRGYLSPKATFTVTCQKNLHLQARSHLWHTSAATCTVTGKGVSISQQRNNPW